MTLSTLGADQAYLQRYFTTKSLEEGRRSVLLDALIAVAVGVVLFGLGDLLYAFYHLHPDRLRGLSLVDSILPFFVVHELGGLFSGVVIASIFAASMAVMSASLNSLTTVTAVDFYQRLRRRDTDDRKVVRAGRVGTIVWGGAATAAALFADRLGPVVNAFNIIQSYLGGPILGIFLLGMLTRRATGTGAFSGAVIGLGVVSLVAARSHISFFYYGLVGLVATLAAGYMLSLLEPPRDPEKLAGLVRGLDGGRG